jgi:hypothetical protein
MTLEQPKGQEVTLGDILQGMKVAPREQLAVQVQSSQSDGAESEPRPGPHPLHGMASTLPQHELLTAEVRARTRTLHEEARKVRETTRRLHAERAALHVRISAWHAPP